MTVAPGPNIGMSWNFDRYLLKVGTHEKPYRTFVGNAIYVSVSGLIDPRVKYNGLPFKEYFGVRISETDRPNSIKIHFWW